MGLVLSLFLLSIAASPLAGLLILRKTDSNVKFSVITLILTFGITGVAILISLVGGDFHIAAFALQLVAPVMGFFGFISLIVGNTILFKRKNMITPESKKIVGIVIASWIAIAVVVAVGKFAIKKYDERPLGEYPDVEFSGRRFHQKAADTTVVYGRWDGQTHEASFVRESADEEKGVYLELKDPETGEIIVPERVAFNKDQTLVCYSYRRNLYKYDFKKKTFSHLTQLSEIRKGSSHYFRKMVFSADSNLLYYVTGRTDADMEEAKNLYCIDLRTKDVKLLRTENTKIEDLVVTPDGKSVIYFANAIKSYDIETGKVETLCVAPLRIVDVDFKNYELNISDDGRFLMYCRGTKDRFTGYRGPNYRIYAYDMEKDRAALIIKTDICSIDTLDWVRENPPIKYYFEPEEEKEADTTLGKAPEAATPEEVKTDYFVKLSDKTGYFSIYKTGENTIRADLDCDGTSEKIDYDMQTDDNGYITGLFLTINEKEYELPEISAFNGIAFNGVHAFWFHLDEAQYVYIQTMSDNDCTSVGVYSFDGEEFRYVGPVSGEVFYCDPKDEDSVTKVLPRDPENFNIRGVVQNFGTNYVYQTCKVGKDGMPEPLDPYYYYIPWGEEKIKTLKLVPCRQLKDETAESGKATTIPNNVEVVPYRTDGKTFVDLKVSGLGGIYRIYVQKGEYSWIVTDPSGQSEPTDLTDYFKGLKYWG